ncbi:MAG: hypothetical protein AAF633_05805 [Chloroflexota bacterium]
MTSRIISYLRNEWPLTVFLALFLILGVAYSTINPILEGTDELRHYRFIQYIIQNGNLPVQGSEDCRSQSHHPPLYYGISALATFWVNTGQDVCESPESNPFWAYNYWEVGTDNKNMYIHSDAEDFPWRGVSLATHIPRLINVILGAATVIMTYMIGQYIWPHNRYMVVGATGLLAFNPQFLYMSGTVNNDVIAAASGAMLLLTTLYVLQKPNGFQPEEGVRWALWLALIISAALLSKFNLTPLVLPLIIALILVANRHNQWPTMRRIFLLGGFWTLMLAGWWFLRNQVLYGEPTGFRTVTELWGVREPNDSWGLVWLEIPGIWASLWGRFGFGQIPMDYWIYRILWYITFLSIIGIVVFFVWERLLRPAEERKDLSEIAEKLIVLTVFGGIALAVVVAYVLVSPAGAMGRFLFPGLPALVFLLFWGLTLWPGLYRLELPWWEPALAIGLNVFLFGIAIYALFGIIQPAYAQPPAWEEGSLPASATLSNVIFSPFALLHGYEVDLESAMPGDTVGVDLYWEVIDTPPGDFYFFLHAMDGIGDMVAQRDTHPGTGNFPTSQWEVGDRFVDEISVIIPETAASGNIDLSIGFYAPEEGYRLAVSAPDGSLQGDSLILDQVAITVPEGPYPNAQFANFEDVVRLRGYEFDSRQVEGESVTLTLYWEIIDRAALEEKVVFVGFTAEDGSKIESQTDFSELDEMSAGLLIVEDVHNVNLTGTYSPDLWSVSLHIFDFFTDSRVNMIGTRGNWIGDELFLPSVEVN